MELIEIKEILRKASVEVDIQGHGKHIALFETDFERVAIDLLEKLNTPDVGQSLPDAEQCLKIQEQVKQYCYTDQDDSPVISSGGIRTIISRWKQMIG